MTPQPAWASHNALRSHHHRDTFASSSHWACGPRGLKALSPLCGGPSPVWGLREHSLEAWASGPAGGARPRGPRGSSLRGEVDASLMPQRRSLPLSPGASEFPRRWPSLPIGPEEPSYPNVETEKQLEGIRAEPEPQKAASCPQKSLGGRAPSSSGRGRPQHLGEPGCVLTRLALFRKTSFY